MAHFIWDPTRNQPAHAFRLELRAEGVLECQELIHVREVDKPEDLTPTQHQFTGDLDSWAVVLRGEPGCPDWLQDEARREAIAPAVRLMLQEPAALSAAWASLRRLG
ncbi:MAG: hypothetical protein QM473_15280 [Acidobacteriota bacterium]|nr:hypothetical protein [Acidobacteriota bacterium]